MIDFPAAGTVVGVFSTVAVENTPPIEPRWSTVIARDGCVAFHDRSWSTVWTGFACEPLNAQ
jgi:hypothetical protein